MTILITGAAGFIGSHATRLLLAQGESVVAIDDFNDYYDPLIKTRNIEPFLDHPQFILYRCDIRDVKALTDIFNRHTFTSIIHLAARAGVRPSLQNPRLYMETNVTGTFNLGELARQFRVPRFIFASSSSVYGDAPERVPFGEDQDVSRPISPYAASKVMAEQYLHSLSHLYNVQVVCLRFFTVYGPGQRPDLAIYKFTRLIDEGVPIPFFGDGSSRRDYTYVDDILEGIQGALTYTGEAFNVFNLGESQTTSLTELVSLIEKALSKTAVLDYQPAQPGDVRLTCADIDKSRRLLGYNPRTLITEGIPAFITWYQQQKALYTYV